MSEELELLAKKLGYDISKKDINEYIELFGVDENGDKEKLIADIYDHKKFVKDLLDDMEMQEQGYWVYTIKR